MEKLPKLTFGSLFAGIGGFDLGFERAGMECKWQVEIDDYATRVLEKHWPNVRRWRDVRTFPPRSFEASYSWRGAPIGPFTPDLLRDTTADAWRVDVICGGFPCTDISSSGKCEGLAGKNSSLWFEMLRVVRLLRPSVVAVENVADLVHRGLGDVLRGLAEAGFDAEWECLPAAAFGLPQRRDRMFIIAHADCGGLSSRGQHHRGEKAYFAGQRETGWDYADGLVEAQHKTATAADRVCGMDDGLPCRVDRIKACGNSIAPDVAEWIGRRIVACVN